MSGTPRSDEPKDAAPDLTGAWAFFQVLRARARVARVGRVTTVTTSAARVDVWPGDSPATLSVRWRVLDLEIDSGSRLARAEVPREALEGIDPLDRVARLEPGPTLVLPRAAAVMGATLADPHQDPLPRRPDDPRVRDPDQDGEPGLTVRVHGVLSGELYVVQRAWTALRSTSLAPDLIEGHVDWSVEQATLGASRRLLLHAPDTEPLTDDGASWFAAARVDGGAPDAEIARRARALDA